MDGCRKNQLVHFMQARRTGTEAARKCSVQKRHSLKTDRRTQWENIAGDAQQAADRGDTRELYRLARRLGAFKPTPVPGVKLKDGTLASDDDAGLARWAEHFAALLSG